LAANRPNGGAEFIVELPVREESHVGHLARR
jgi:hypothetical protein